MEQVDVALLLNENILYIRIPGKADIYESKLCVGLVALLLLPFDDLKRSKITPTDQDMSYYVDIMSRTGFSSVNSRKYQTYIKTKLASRTQSARSKLCSMTEVSDSEEDVFDAAGSARGSRSGASLAAHEMQNLSLQEEKSGKGIYIYQNPRELEARLMDYDWINKRWKYKQRTKKGC